MTSTHAIDRTAVATSKVGKVEQAQLAFARMMIEASERGFYGRLSLSVTVQDGHIQQVNISSDRTLR